MKKKTLLAILIFGSLWGCIEVFVGGALHDIIPRSSVVPSILGIAVLASSLYLVKARGSATAISMVAMLFRLVNAGHYYCHLWAIFLIGVSFDIMVTILGNRWEKTKWQSLAGISIAYLSCILFSLSLTYIIQYEWWASVGLPKVLDYVGIHGSLVAVGALIFVPLGCRFGKSLMAFSNARQKPAFIGAMVLTLLLWLIGIVF